MRGMKHGRAGEQRHRHNNEKSHGNLTLRLAGLLAAGEYFMRRGIRIGGAGWSMEGCGMADEMQETILIVDDEEPVRRTFREWLTGAGLSCSIVAAADAEAALQIANRLPIDL